MRQLALVAGATGSWTSVRFIVDFLNCVFACVSPLPIGHRRGGGKWPFKLYDHSMIMLWVLEDHSIWAKCQAMGEEPDPCRSVTRWYTAIM